MGNLVAIVGRPNVGKSTLFNRLTKTRRAIVQETSGVTRDRHYGKSVWGGKEFSVVDTGGFVKGSDDVFEDEIRKQVVIAIEECNIVIFVVDVETGITDLDEAVANVLRQSKKPVFVVSNKVDNNEREVDSYEFYNFGLGDVYSISAINGSGTGELLDDLIKELPEDAHEEDESELPRIAIVGKPNVGKSSLTNALLGIERNIVTDISGTTRDSIDTHFNAFGFDMVLVDTAGIRKKGKVHEDIEFYSVMRSIRTIENSDVCLFMIDAEEGLQSQDMSIFSVIERNRKGMVVLVNKWDKIENKEANTMKKYEEMIKERLAPFTDVPVLFVSALTKQRIHKALEIAMEVYKNRTTKIPTSKLNEVLLPLIENYPPPAYKGKFIKIKFVTQLPNHAPAFAFFCNLPQYIKDPYKRYLENQLRKHFDLTGVPIRLFFRKK
ncbi:ribosome biogenesis GTPase Der [Parvicella tangerina]|uniref:GTPase Der n=1 Tax=Parvicella tangerina TaxID=2829795 RepID=A0A916JL84_9FLAO|nr:ribosome biogenesis GTPase Der [Parvicella tangerina]CAG5079654.1 GTPase Der [Parvicella tangerina]